MSETTIGDGARPVNPNPLIVRDAIYARIQVQFLLGVSPRTIDRWELAGLQPLQPCTDAVFYEGGNLIDIMRKPSSEIPPYAPKKPRKG